MKKRIFSLLIVLIGVLGTNIKAQDFFDTSDAEKFFTFSGRIGFNTSNKTFPSGHFNLWNHNSWGTGFNIGALANLNFKEYLTLQPGIFFESRSGDFAYLTNYLNYYGREDTHYEMGHLRGYYFTIPVMGVVKFNLAEKIKWMVEFGPYLQFSLKQTGLKNVNVLYREPQNSNYSAYIAEHNNVDFGFKMGTGLRVFNHYYIGVHYLAGVCNAWKKPAGGKNKSWEFCIGYDF